MSAVELVKELFYAVLKLIRGLFGWLVIAPISRVIPKRPDLIVVIGPGQGRFVDNTKYFLIEATAILGADAKLVFVTRDRSQATLVEDLGFIAMLYPGRESIWCLLRANTVIIDSSDWTSSLQRFYLSSAKKIQLWHGVGYKRVERDQWRYEARNKGGHSNRWVFRARLLLNLINGRSVHYDLVNTTSLFYRDQVFKSAFKSKYFSTFGYPRNTFGRLNSEFSKMVWGNVDKNIKSLMRVAEEEGKKIVFIAPTFRDTRESALGLDDSTTDWLDAFAESNKVEFVFKFHPLERGVKHISGRHLHLIDSGSDWYPLLPYISALITDYSSIYMDYLLLDKPVVFLVPDYQEYLRFDRQLQFDFEEFTPGPKVDDWVGAANELAQAWVNDSYRSDRRKLRQLAFDALPQGEATVKIIAFMESKRWIS